MHVRPPAARLDSLRGALVPCALALLFVSQFAVAEVSSHVALLSDYRFRGVSLTDQQPALLATVNYDHASGLFLGALASNIRIDSSMEGLRAQIYGGYVRPLGHQSSWDIGIVTYVFPRPSWGEAYDYTEAFVGVTLNNIGARLSYSDDYYGFGTHSVYLECNASRQINERVALIGHVGYLSHQSSAPYYAQGRSQLDFKAGVAIDISGFVLELSLVGTDGRSSACAGEGTHCDTTAVVSISRTF